MQVLLLILVAVVMLPFDPGAGGTEFASAFALGGMLALIGSAWIAAATLRRGIHGPHARARIEQAARVQRLLQWLAVALVVVAVTVMGLRESVRGMIGDPPFLDELVTMSPALVVIMATWWIFHPFERHVRESMLLRQLDEGIAVQAPPDRMTWVSMQVRTQMLVLLVPLGLLASVGELIRIVIARNPGMPGWLGGVLSTLVIVPVLVLAPWLVVRIVGARPLPPGEVRSTLETMCRESGVRVRDLLLWPTGGAIVNAGVTGVVGWLRWVMLTDGLLETLRRDQVMAVMAHELAHARRHHIPWMVLSVIGLAGGLALLLDPLVVELRGWRIELGGDESPLLRDLETINLVATVLVLIGTLVGFGWVSRRFERQADAFAATALSRDSEDRPLPAVTAAGIDAMGSALMDVSGSSGVPSRRFSWRHGSIDSRIRHLQSLVGVEVGSLPIDRTVRRVNVLSLLLVIVTGGWWAAQYLGEGVR